MKVIIVGEINSPEALANLLKEEKIVIASTKESNSNVYVGRLDNPTIITMDNLEPNDQTLGNQIRKLML